MPYALQLASLGRRLTAAEAVGVLVDIGEELAALHATGIAHGDAGAIVVDGAGRVLLAGPAGGGEPPEDVRTLAGRVESCLGGDVPDLLRRLLATCRCTDPEGRPTADELAALAARVTAPKPIRLPKPSRERRIPPARVAALGLVGLLLAAELGRVWGRGGDSPMALPPVPPSSVAPSATPSHSAQLVQSGAVIAPTLISAPKPVPEVTDWVAVLASLDGARGRSWSLARQAPLASADAARSPALLHDVGLARQLRTNGLYADGWASQVDRVVVVRVAAARVELRVRDRLAAYVLRRADGTVAHRVAARGPRWWVIDLQATPAGWRTWDAQPSRAAA